MVIQAVQNEVMKFSLLRRCLDSLQPPSGGDPEISSVVFDSRQVRPGACFVAISGTDIDGNDFVDAAVQAGAVAVVSERPDPSRGAAWLQVEDARKALGILSACFYDHPSARLQLFGVTGTNGKTTVSWMIHHLLEQKRPGAGLLGTIEYRIGRRVIPAVRTTPSSLEINMMLHQMLKGGAEHSVMEVSSHATCQDRVSALQFDRLVFTNLSQDHLDYHGTMEAYYEAKRKIFLDASADGKRPRRFVIGLDEYGRRLVSDLKALPVEILTVGETEEADLRLLSLHTEDFKTRTKFESPWGSAECTLPLLGRHNVLNALLAIGATVDNAQELQEAISAMERVPAIPGRLERIQSPKGAMLFIDYAHTPDALEQVLRILREQTVGTLSTVFGCGGDRDRGKRPAMGKAAAVYSHRVILTSDNPRSEDPQQILNDIRAGMLSDAEIQELPDRREAIQSAYETAGEGDVVLIAGKGHETRQELSHTIIPFSDHDCVMDLINQGGQ